MMKDKELKTSSDIIRNCSTSIVGIVKEINNIMDVVDDKNCSIKFSKWVRLKLSEVIIRCDKIEKSMRILNERHRK